MSFLESMKGGRRFVSVALAVIVGGALACKTPISDMQYQAGDYIFDFLADATLTGGIPEGAEAILAFVPASVDTSVANAFGRASGDALMFYDDVAGAFNVFGLDRNGSNDNRTPVLADMDAAGVSFCDLNSPYVWEVGVGAWDFYCDVGGLNASATYTVMMVNYALTVNGELDQVAVQLDQPITANDALVVSGGTAQGTPLVECNYSTLTDVPVNANPLVMGFIATDPNGDGTIDCLPTSGLVSPPQWWTDVTSYTPPGYADSTVTGPNDGVSPVPLARNQYNYMVLVEGQGTVVNPVPTGAHAMRWQIANDVTAAGPAVNNAQAPFPTEPTTSAGPGVSLQAGTLEMWWTNLAALDGSVYQVWVYNEETGDLKSPSGDWSATDAAGDPAGSATGVQSFNTQADWDNIFVTSDAIGQYTHVFLSVTSAPASAPTTVQPMWAQYTDMAGEPTDPFQWTFNTAENMDFGTFGTGDPVVWTSQGNGEGGFWGTECNPDPDDLDHCQGPTNTLEVIFRNLQVPPVGYYYKAYLIEGGPTPGEPVDAGFLLSKSTASTSSVSLENIDTDESLQDQYTNGQDIIIWSQTNTLLDALPDGKGFYDYVEYRLQLVPRGITTMGPTTALGGETPLPMRARKPAPEPEPS
jgi:hypothetical protein